MESSPGRSSSRRAFILTSGGAAAGLALGASHLAALSSAWSRSGPLSREGLFGKPAHSGARRIGIIGSGQQGGALGLLWAAAGHEILFSSRHPEELGELVARAGPRARAGHPDEAARFGEVVLIAVPYGALPQVGRDQGPLLRGKIVIDCGNPRADRDGPMADEAIARGTGVASAEYLPGARLVRAFNALSSIQVERESHRTGEKLGIPIAADDAEATRVTVELVVDAGFDPVVVGGLERAREFDRGTAVYVKGMTARELREALGLGAG